MNSHKTAISRQRISKPMRDLKQFMHGRVLDFGCGKGVDADFINATKYDSTYFPAKPTGHFDVVFMNYVVNTLPPKERYEAVREALSFTAPGGTLIITARTPKDIERCVIKGSWRRHQGGFQTSRSTFQRGISFEELYELVNELMINFPNIRCSVPCSTDCSAKCSTDCSAKCSADCSSKNKLSSDVVPAGRPGLNRVPVIFACTKRQYTGAVLRIK